VAPSDLPRITRRPTCSKQANHKVPSGGPRHEGAYGAIFSLCRTQSVHPFRQKSPFRCVSSKSKFNITLRGQKFRLGDEKLGHLGLHGKQTAPRRIQRCEAATSPNAAYRRGPTPAGETQSPLTIRRVQGGGGWGGGNNHTAGLRSGVTGSESPFRSTIADAPSLCSNPTVKTHKQHWFRTRCSVAPILALFRYL